MHDHPVIIRDAGGRARKAAGVIVMPQLLHEQAANAIPCRRNHRKKIRLSFVRKGFGEFGDVFIGGLHGGCLSRVDEMSWDKNWR